ncbi:hypothetical protein J2S11_004416, partial [Bacillus horti]|nr:hypothetical protein [Bacillus horti]
DIFDLWDIKNAPPSRKQFLLFKLSTTRGAYHFLLLGQLFYVSMFLRVYFTHMLKIYLFTY